MRVHLRWPTRCEARGAALVEYLLLLALLAIVCLAALTILGGGVSGNLTDTASVVTDARG
ncbi:MAG: Flp family type IVb pilin [Acidimicrobiales bacterium]